MKKIFKIVSSAVGIFVLVTVAVFLVLAEMLLDPRPPSSPVQLKTEDLVIQKRILGEIFNSIVSRQAPEIATLKLDPREFQSVVRCADLIAGNQKVPVRDYRPAIGQGRLNLTVPYDTELGWLFGGWIIARFELQISKEGRDFDVQVLSAAAGKFKISNGIAQKILDKQLEKFRKSSKYERFDKIVETISIDRDGILTIRYRPRNAIFLLKR